MREALRAVWANPYVRVLVGLAVLALFVLFFIAVQPAGTLFIAAMGLAYLVNPVVDWLQRRGVRRAFGVLLVAAVLVAIAWAASAFAINAVGKALAENGNGIAMGQAITNLFDELPATVAQTVPEAFADMVTGPLEALARSIRRLDEILEPYLEDIAVHVVDVVGWTFTGVFQAVLLLVVTIYTLYDFHRLSRSLLELFPLPYQPAVSSLASTLDSITGTYIRGQILIAACVGLMVFAGLSLIGLPLAGVIGLLAAFLNIVPFVGSVVPAIPAVLIALGDGWLQVLLVIVVFVVANQIDAHGLTPLILSRTTELHPVTVILAVLGGFAYGGVVAAILAVPAVGFVKALYVAYYLPSTFYRRG